MLKGLRVLDLSRLLPGPYASMILADMGAEIIKVEDTVMGDYMRDFEPKVAGISAYYLSINRNKKSLRLNLKHPEGKEIFLQLVRQSDVILESFRPGVTEALGIGYDTVKQINPGIVYCSMTGYGQTGPYKHLAGHDINYVSLTGITDMSGAKGGPPSMSGIQMADLSGGMFAIMGIMAGLIRRQTTNEGCYVDTAMVDGLMSWMSFYFAQYQATKEEMVRGTLDLSGGLACYNIYQTKDEKYVSFGPLEYKFYQNFCKAVNRQDLLSFHMNPAQDGDPGYEEFKKVFLSRTRTEWEETLKDVDCCCTPVYTPAEALASDYFKTRELGVTVTHPTAGELNQVALPLKFTFPDGTTLKEQSKPPTPPPSWGENTREILQNLGITPEKINELAELGVI